MYILYVCIIIRTIYIYMNNQGLAKKSSPRDQAIWSRRFFGIYQFIAVVSQTNETWEINKCGSKTNKLLVISLNGTGELYFTHTKLTNCSLILTPAKTGRTAKRSLEKWSSAHDKSTPLDRPIHQAILSLFRRCFRCNWQQRSYSKPRKKPLK